MRAAVSLRLGAWPRAVFGVWLIAAQVWVTAPLAAEDSAASTRTMRFEHLSSVGDLSLSVVNCILQDRTGFLWLGTQAGLARYDGYSFEVYRHDPDDPTSLAHDWVLALEEDPSGDLWVGTEGGGLSRWLRATDSFISYRPDDSDPKSLSSSRVIALAADRLGALWVATMDGGLNRFEGSSDAGEPNASEAFTSFRHDPADPDSLAHDQLGALHVDRFGYLWVGTWDGLDRLDLESGRFVHYRHDPSDSKSLADPRVRAITEDHSGALWVGTLGGLHRFDRRAGTFERFLHDPTDPRSLSHDWVRSLFTDREGRLWIGTDGGLNLRDEGTEGFARYLADPADPRSLRSDQVLALYQDRGGMVWLSTVGAGVAKWNPATWAFPLYQSGRDDAAANMVFAVSEDPDGDLWIGTFGAGVERIDRASPTPSTEELGSSTLSSTTRAELTPAEPTGQRTRYTHDPQDDNSLSDDRVTALLHDRHGVLWIGTVGGGLNRLKDGAIERFQSDPGSADGLSANGITTLHEDCRGRLWIGTVDGGLNLYEDGSFTRFRHDPKDPSSLSNDRIFALAEDSSKRLWLATDGGGLNRLHPETEAFLRIEHDPNDPSSLATDQLLSVHADSLGRLWVGTKGHGLDRLESLDEATGRATFSHIRQASGLPDDHIWGIRSDTTGALWLATNNGLSRFDPEAATFKNYDVNHGLQSNEFNLGAHFASPSGELFFGGVGGVNAFYPKRIEASQHVPPVVLTSFTKINQPMRFARPLFEVSEITLGHRDYAFSLGFAALDFVAPERNRYRYMLEGFEDTWIDNGHRRWASFTNLDPGRYLLKVQAANSAGVWNERGAEITINVAPPLWRTWWAYALYALGLASAIGVASAVQAQRQEAARQRAVAGHERERVREREKLIVERERLIEERELLAEEHEQLHAELADSNALLARKNAELERFNYTVTHDLKSPLVTIKGFLGMLRRDIGRNDHERVEHDIQRVNAAASKMQTLLEELLDLAQVSDPRRLSRQEIVLNDLVSEALELIEGVTLEHGVEVVVEPQLGVVRGDPVRLLQVYQNLLVNSVKYMGDQAFPRVEVGVRIGGTAEVARGVESASDRVFFVRDNGSGVDPRFHDKIFELFERVDAVEKGSGVGLAVVQRIVELHGGHVWVESEGVGQGCTFCFTLGD